MDESPAGTSSLKTALSARVVGRDAEFAVLRDALAGATQGRGSVLFLVGEAGIGKSRLAQATAADAAARGLPVVRGRAVQAETAIPYRPLAEALCSAVRTVGMPAGADLDPYRPTLGRLIPEWRVEEPGSLDESMVALGEAVLRFLRATAGGRGCLLVLEDLHWSDPETLRITEYLADNLASEHVLCVATLRDDDRSIGLELARNLHARRASRILQLSRLSRDEVADMVGSCLNSATVPDDVVDFAARADGVPFLVEELLAAGVSSGVLVAEGEWWSVSKTADTIIPPTFSEIMRGRLAVLGEPTRAVLLAGAVLGRRFDWSLLPMITAQSEDEVLTALRDAVGAQIVSVDPGEPMFRFRHALSRDAVVADLLPPEATALSRRVLEAVEAAHPDLEEDWLDLAAALAERGGQPGRAAHLLLKAARRALGRGALASAEVALDRARTLLPADDPASLDVDECLCQVLSLAGKRDRAVQVGESLLARMGDHPSAAPRRAEVHLRLARAALAATRWMEAHNLLEQARAEASVVADETLTARVDAARAQAAIMREPAQAPALAKAALEAAERIGIPDAACEALEVLGRSQRHHDLDAGEAFFARALAVAEAHGLALWRARALHELGTIDMLRGRPVTRLEEARDLAVVQGALATAAVVDLQIAAALVFADDPEPAAVAARRSVDLARKYGLHQTAAAAVALETYVHARARRPVGMQRCIDEARSYAPGVPDVEVKISSAAAVLAFLEEDRDSARRHLEDAVRPALSGPGGDYSATPAAGLLALVRQLDETADEVAAAQVAEGSGVHFVTTAFRLYAYAVAAGRAGDSERALDLVAQGDQTLGDHEWLRQLARRHLAEAALSHDWGDPVPWLREALPFFDARGEDRIASACRSLLRSAGVAVPRRRGEEAVPAALRSLGVTSRELEVLRLLALGLTNKEIGTRLYLSPRTVERHVANVTVKAGVGRRSELVAYAARTIGGAPPA